MDERERGVGVKRYLHLAVALLLASPCSAETSEPRPRILAVQDICVIAVLSGDSAQSSQMLSVAKQVASVLQDAGITAFGMGDCPAGREIDTLFVRADSLRSGTGQVLAIRVDFELNQTVRLLSDPSVTMQAITWRDTRLGLALERDVASVYGSFMRELAQVMATLVRH